ncbi:MAG: threonyl-tRNA synthetase [Thermoleophilia bacterium]|nr:threonyl-tRNA synthetase [Thermoleophilia bacterium]
MPDRLGLAGMLTCMSAPVENRIAITLPDGSSRELETGATGLDLARSIGEGLARAAVAVQVNGGDTQDLRLPLADGDAVRIITSRDEEALGVLRHSAAHVLAEAVVARYPGTKVTIGPAIEAGFYYDFDFPEGTVINDEALAQLEKDMKHLVKQGRKWDRWEVTRDEALEHFRSAGEQYKVELIEGLPADEPITFYRQGEFTDLCRGPHVQDAKGMKAIKLTSTAGAYWRGDSTREQLTRIYGTAFFSKEDLATHLANLERAKLNDHRLLGTKLDLFSFDPVSPGSPFWHPRGLNIWNAITEMWREEHGRRGYQEVKTPILYKPELWKKSGHWDAYKDGMFFTELDEDGHQFGLKPMNCPAHATLIKTRRLSYRDLPVRMNEQGLVHRFEASGVLHGLMRVRHITQDDAHIFCAPDQVLDEVTSTLAFVRDLMQLFGFDDYTMELSTRPDKAIGDDALWEKAEAALAEALVRNDLPYTLNPGDGAFYGPKIDFHVRDSMGRTWQCGTIQLDYNMAQPERFDITYAGEDNEEHEVVVIHRALLGSMERFIGILLEHYGGEFPLWMAPEQVRVLPVADRHNDYAREVVAALRERRLRAELDDRTESVGRKVRDAGMQRTPIVLVVGDAEAEGRTVTVNRRGDDAKPTISLDELVEQVSTEVAERRLSDHVAQALRADATEA